MLDISNMSLAYISKGTGGFPIEERKSNDLAEINKIISDYEKIKVPSTNPPPSAKIEKQETSYVYTNEYYDSEYYEEEENIINQQLSSIPDAM